MHLRAEHFHKIELIYLFSTDLKTNKMDCTLQHDYELSSCKFQDLHNHSAQPILRTFIRGRNILSFLDLTSVWNNVRDFVKQNSRHVFSVYPILCFSIMYSQQKLKLHWSKRKQLEKQRNNSGKISLKNIRNWLALKKEQHTQLPHNKKHKPILNTQSSPPNCLGEQKDACRKKLLCCFSVACYSLSCPNPPCVWPNVELNNRIIVDHNLCNVEQDDIRCAHFRYTPQLVCEFSTGLQPRPQKFARIKASKRLSIIIIIEIFTFDNFRLVIAAALSEVLVVFRQLGGHGVHGRCVRGDDYLFCRCRSAPEAPVETLADPLVHVELRDACQQTEVPWKLNFQRRHQTRGEISCVEKKVEARQHANCAERFYRSPANSKRRDKTSTIFFCPFTDANISAQVIRSEICFHICVNVFWVSRCFEPWLFSFK